MHICPALSSQFDALLGVVDGVYSVELTDVESAKTILAGNQHLSARDALHLAVMRRYGVEEILTFDRGFEGIPGIRRFGTSAEPPDRR